jgi:hypothetical protein
MQPATCNRQPATFLSWRSGSIHSITSLTEESLMFTSDNYKLTHQIEVPEIAPLPAIRSQRAATVAQWFGMTDQLSDKARRDDQSRRTDRALLRSLLPQRNQITFLTGPSGAGKSSMLRALRRLRPRARWVDLQSIELPNAPLVDCFEDTPLDRTLALLSQVGLAEAWSYLRTPAELSEGQRWRLKLALAMGGQELRKALTDKTPTPSPCTQGEGAFPPDERDSEKERDPLPAPSPLSTREREKSLAKRNVPRLILLADEFAALLDRVTAAVVARCLRRVVTSTPDLCAIVATSHEDLTRALVPDTIVNCDFRLIEVLKRASPRPKEHPEKRVKQKPARGRSVRSGRGNFSRASAARR